MHSSATNQLTFGRELGTAATVFLLSMGLLVSGGRTAGAQETAVSDQAVARAVIPQQVRYAGKLTARSGDSVEAVFKIYAAAEGGEPLWTETQQVSVAADGTYSVLLGTSTTAGLPQSVFAGGSARWLGVTVERGEEQERALLSSVPYAMKSADAELLAGHQATDFATQAQLAGLAQKVSKVESAAAPAFQPELTPSGSGTTNSVPLWTSSSTLGNSVISQVGSDIGINFAAPTATLEVGGPMTVHGTLLFPPGVPATQTHSSQSQSFQFSSSAWNSSTPGPQSSTYTFLAGPTGNNTANPNAIFYLTYQNGSAAATSLFTVNGNGQLALPNPAGGLSTFGNIALTPSAVATSAGSTNSPLLELGASAYSSSSNASRAQTFAWQTQAANNDTTTPTGSLALLFGTNGAAPTATGLSFAPNGQITFASGQQFPVTGTGSGTITGITTSSPLTGSGTSGSVALGLNETQLATDITGTLEGTFNSVYAQLGTPNEFTGEIIAHQKTGAGYAALLGYGTNGSIGTFGSSDTGIGVRGETITPGGGGTGVLGSTGNTTYSSTYSGYTGQYYSGLWGDTTANGASPELGAGLIATADNAFGAILANDSATYATLYVTNNDGHAAEFQGANADAVDAITEEGDGLYSASLSGGSGVVGVITHVVYNNAGVLGVADTNSSYYNDNLGFSAGVWGDTGVSSTSVAPGEVVAVLGTATDSPAGVFLNDSENYPTMHVANGSTAGIGNAAPLFQTLMASTPGGTCGIGGAGNISCTGQIKTLVKAGEGGKTVETYSMQSSENWMEDAGGGELRRGVAVVHIDPAFAETISADATYRVFITPRGDSKGLYVINATPTSFEVRESGGGISSLAFDYRIMAKRRGFESQRLVDVTERFNGEMKRANVTRSSSVTPVGAHGKTHRAPASGDRLAMPRPRGLSIKPE